MSEITIHIDKCYIWSDPESDSIKFKPDENPAPAFVSTRNIASEIVEEFEKVLDKYEIDIPSGDEPDGNKSRARLYGMPYFNLVDEVEDLVLSALETVRDSDSVELITGVLY